MADKEKISKNEIRNRCALENNIVVNCPGAVAFFEYLGLVSTTPDMVFPSAKFNGIAAKSGDEAIGDLAALSIDRLVEDGIFDAGATGFDAEKGHLTIKRSAFPLAYAAIRNFLTMVGALDKEENGEISVSGDYETDWAEQLSSRKKKITLEQLLKQQEEQSRRGLEAEEFVLSLEKSRLPGMAGKIKRISDFDTAAGYDIVSYEANGSTHYDRFIEVKCYIGSPHFFWSENETDVAKIKANKYVLCLVDYARMKEPGYQPVFIRDPYTVVFDGEEWMVNASSYRVQKI
jgi:hypothetical protein